MKSEDFIVFEVYCFIFKPTWDFVNNFVKMTMITKFGVTSSRRYQKLRSLTNYWYTKSRYFLPKRLNFLIHIFSTSLESVAIKKFDETLWKIILKPLTNEVTRSSQLMAKKKLQNVQDFKLQIQFCRLHSQQFFYCVINTVVQDSILSI